MKKIIVRGPALTRSGYGEQTRFALRSLRAHQDRFDIYLFPVGWGQTGWLSDDDEERRWIDSIITKTVHHQNNGGVYDISLQVTIPNEWERMAPVNIGYTAGIETTKVSPEWIQKSMLMDKIIVVSNHSKDVYLNTSYSGVDQNTGQELKDVKCVTPIEVVNYSVRNIEPEKIDLKLDYDFNFISVAQWSPRKNLEDTIKWFIQEFMDDEVGLIIKASIKNNSIIDKYQTVKVVHELVTACSAGKDRKCKIYLLHGDMSDGEMTSLYQNPKIKAFISLSHGEGFGLPIFEASYNSLPVIAPNWSGQNDFLYAPKKDKKGKTKMRPLFANVDYVLKQVQPEAVWPGVIQQDSFWCYPHPGDYRKNLRDVYKNYGQYKKQAKDLKKYIIENFTEETQYKKFADFICPEEEFEIEDWLSNLDVKEIA